MEASQYVWLFKKYYLILKMAISRLENGYSFIGFFYLYLIVNTDELKLIKTLDLP